MADPAVQIHPGPLATEHALLEAIEQLAARARSEPVFLAEPVRVVVSSRVQRQHIERRLGQRGKARVGVRVQTLHALALDVWRHEGSAPVAAEAWLPVAARRAVMQEPALAGPLGDLEDGAGGPAASLRDLLDAGLVPELAEPALELLAERGQGPRVRRAEALIRAALSVQAELSSAGRTSRSTLLSTAARHLREFPESLPARAVLVHGFADATGVATDLLEALVATRPTTVFIDRPLDLEQSDPAPGASYVERLSDRLAGLRGRLVSESRPRPAQVELLEAPGREAESRAVALRVRDAIRAGTRPEEIGIVARDVRHYAVPLRRHLTRLAVPWNGRGASGAPPGAAGRALRLLLELLESGAEMPVDRWLEAERAGGEGSQRRKDAIDLRLLFHARGHGRLAEAATFEFAADAGEERGFLPLPARTGLLDHEEGDAQVRRRKVSLAVARAAVARARDVTRALEHWPRSAALPEHAASLRELVSLLRWSEDAPPWGPLSEALDSLATDIPSSVRLDRDELALLLERELQAELAPAISAGGAGVAVLSVVEARSLTFDRLFVLGVNRDVFPRLVHDDPVFPDTLRLALQAELLPDLPIKQRGFEEERYLFAQLLAASPHTTLSFEVVSDEGRARSPSPLIERLRRHESVGLELAEDRPVLAFEHAISAGLRGGLELASHAFEHAEREAVRCFGGSFDPAFAGVRTRVVEAWEEGAVGEAQLGPYLGAVGPPAEDLRDPRTKTPAVTALESLARCPWSHFLTRVLRVEAPPDALESLPAASPLLIGNAVHRALDAIVNAALERARSRDEAPRWPEPDEIGRIVMTETSALLRAEGIGLPGFAVAVGRQVAQRVTRARELLGSAERFSAAEQAGESTIGLADGRTVVLAFRADLVEEEADRATLTDYKTGKLVSDKIRPEKIERDVREAVAQGVLLQGLVYAASQERAIGRYAYLTPDPEPPAQALLAPDPAALDGVFRQTVGALVDALDAGCFPPRPRPNTSRCDWCEVRSACAFSDSTARRQVERLEAEMREAAEQGDAAGSALARLLVLGKEVS